MNPRTTAILALLVAALGAFVYFYEIRGGEERAEAEAESKRLFPGLEAPSIESVTLRTSDDQTARVERLPDGGWRIREPRDFPADGPAVEGLVSALAQLTSESVFEEPAPLEDYGLGDDPVVRFRVGELERVVRLGDKTPVGGNTYVATAEDVPVYAVPTYRTSALVKRFEELQDKRIAKFDPSAVRGVEATWRGGGVKLARESEDADWRLVAPVEGDADAETVDDLLSTLSFLRASGFLADPPGDAELGLESPEFQAVLELAAAAEDAEPRRLAIAVGSSLDGENRAVRGAEETLRYSIAADRLDDLPRRVGAYRFKELARFDVGDARRVELVFHDAKAAQSSLVTAEKGDAGWEASPEPMDPAKVASLVARLARLRAEDVMADGMDAVGIEALGLDPPRVLLRVLGEASGEGAEAPVLAEVSLGRALPGKGIPGRRADRDTLYWLDYDLGEDVPINLEALRNRFLAQPEPGLAGDEPARDLPGLGEPELDPLESP